MFPLPSEANWSLLIEGVSKLLVEPGLDAMLVLIDSSRETGDLVVLMSHLSPLLRGKDNSLASEA